MAKKDHTNERIAKDYCSNNIRDYDTGKQRCVWDKECKPDECNYFKCVVLPTMSALESPDAVAKHKHASKKR